MNEDIMHFLTRHNIKLEKIPKALRHIYSSQELNELIHRYGYVLEEIDANISIADIVGSMSCIQTADIFLGLENYFESGGDSYHSRSIELLDYDSNELLNILKSSFESDPITILEMEKNKYIITTNGLHRYMVLRAHFLNESQEFEKNSDAYENLKKKYEIPVKLKKVDIIKTYSNFLCTIYPENNYVMSLEIDENNSYTGKVVLESSSNTLILNNEELLNVVKMLIENTSSLGFLDVINYYSEKYQSFQRFISENFSNTIKKKENVERKNVKLK